VLQFDKIKTSHQRILTFFLCVVSGNENKAYSLMNEYPNKYALLANFILSKIFTLFVFAGRAFFLTLIGN